MPRPTVTIHGPDSNVVIVVAAYLLRLWGSVSLTHFSHVIRRRVLIHIAKDPDNSSLQHSRHCEQGIIMLKDLSEWLSVIPQPGGGYFLLSFGLFQSIYIPAIFLITDARPGSLPLPSHICLLWYIFGPISGEDCWISLPCCCSDSILLPPHSPTTEIGAEALFISPEMEANITTAAASVEGSPFVEKVPAAASGIEPRPKN